MAGTVTSMNGGNQIWGLSNTMINTADLVNLEKQALEMRKSPILNRQSRITQEKEIYEGFKNDFSNLVQVFKDMSTFTGSQKSAKLSQSGFVNATAASNAVSGTFDITVSKLAERHQLSGKDVASLDTDLGITDQFTLKVGANEHKIDIAPDMSVRDLINKVNSGGYGVSMYTVGSRVFMTSTNSGTANAISLTDGTSGVLKDTLGLLQGDGTVNTMTAAVDAEYTINGVALTSSSNTVEDAISGVTLQLEQVTQSPTRLTVDGAANDEAISKIQDMVKQFNEGINLLTDYAGEGSYMQASTAALSTNKAMLKIMQFELNGKRLFSYGIEIDKTGKLTVNTTKLQDAFKKEPDTAQQFFFGTAGLGKYMNTELDRVFGDTGMITGRVKTIDAELNKIEEQISKIDAANQDKQAAIIEKYARYEQQMSALNMQLTYLEAITKQKEED